ncbi:MAG: MinD/ParA family protein [SAR324 cluster bacterium]|nr:MinD/ParA family protein [SAR324 cluster bacterium]
MIRDQAQGLREQFNKPSDGLKKLSGKVRSLSFTSGKGGVGKTNIVVNLAVQFSKMGKKVLLIDADFGLANIDILLNLTPTYTIEDVLMGNRTIEEVLQVGPLGMHILPAASGVSEMSELDSDQQMGLINELSSLQENYDYILIDTGAGIASSVLRFNAAADEICVITNTEPTALTDAYALMKVMATKYQVSRFNLIVNQVTSMKEARGVHTKLQTVFDQFLPVSLILTGFIPRDPNFTKAVRAQTPLSLMAPASATAKAFSLIAQHIDRNPGEEMKAEVGFFTRVGLFKKKF